MKSMINATRTAVVHTTICCNANKISSKNGGLRLQIAKYFFFVDFVVIMIPLNFNNLKRIKIIKILLIARSEN